MRRRLMLHDRVTDPRRGAGTVAGIAGKRPLVVFDAAPAGEPVRVPVRRLRLLRRPRG
jgi:hypothetical protein